MSTPVRLLYGSDGAALYAQLSYDEYVRLDQSVREAVQLGTRRKQVMDLLATGSSSVVLDEISVRSAQTVKQQSQVEPKPEPAPVPVSIEPSLSEPARVESRSDGSQIAVAIPPVLLAFLKDQDPSENAKRLIESCVRKLSGRCGKRITLSLHKPYICLWDFDAWITFAYGEIIQGNLFVSFDRALAPEAVTSDIWTPPRGLAKHTLARMKVDSITDTLIDRLQKAISSHESVVAKT